VRGWKQRKHETVVIFNIVSSQCENPSERRIPKQVPFQRVAGVSGDSFSNKRGRMQTLNIVGVLALILLPSTMARAQGGAPGWQCSPGVRGERACRPTWAGYPGTVTATD